MNDAFEPTPSLSGTNPEWDSEPRWKTALRAKFEEWLTQLDTPPEDITTPRNAEAPDLFTFYSELSALGAEFKKSNRRTAEAMKQWSELMTGFQSEIVRLGERLDANPNDPTPASHWTDLIDFADRLDRINTAFQTVPKETWLNRSKHWKEAWQQQRQAFEFLVSHFKDLLSRSEISRIETRGKKLEVESMTVVGIEARDDLPAETVVSEIRSGYRRHREILRLAEVTVAKTPTNSVS